MQQGNEEDSDNDSDTESVCSMLSVASSTDHEGGPSVKLYVQHPPFVKKEQLKEHFEKNGFVDNVTNIHSFFDKATKKPKGYSCVSLSPAALVEEAILKLNGSLLFRKHRLIVSLKPFQRKQKREHKRQRKSTPKSLEQPVSSPSHNQEQVKVYVGKFPPYVNEVQLRNHFNSYKAKVVDVYVVKDKQTKQSKRFGFVKFSSRAVAESAVKNLDGTLLNGKHKINVSLARDHPSTKGQSRSDPPTFPASAGLLEVCASTSTTTMLQPYSTHYQQSQSGSQPEPTCVMIKNIEPEIINETEIKAMIGMPIVSFVPDRHTREILIRCMSPSDAAKAAEILNGKRILGNVIQAFVCLGESTHVVSPANMQLAGVHRSPSYPPPHHGGPPSLGPGPLPPQGLFPNMSHQAGRPGPSHHMNPHSHPLQMMPPAPLNQVRCPPGQWAPPSQLESPRGPNRMFPPHSNQGLRPALFYPPPPYSVQPPPITQSNVAAEIFPVKVTHLSPSVTKEMLHQHFSQAGELSGMPKIHDSMNRYAYVNYKYPDGAENAVKKLNGTFICDWKVNVSRKEIRKTPISPPAGTTPSGDSASLPTKQSPTKGKSQLEKTMKLQPDQWNRLTSIGQHGGSKFLEIKAPFESNPNVSIQLQIETTSVRFTGVKDAVLSAYNHFEGHLNKDLHIADRSVV